MMYERIRRLVRNGKAVSPVVGVILMVAITIVLAATIYIWISSMSSPAATAPSINFRGTFEKSNGNYTLVLTVISVQGNANWDDLNITVIGGNVTNNENLTGAVNAGDKIEIDDLEPNTEVKVVIKHVPSNSIIYENTFQVP